MTSYSFMPLQQEFSMVADSTTSSSPTSADASTTIKRATRTYGRRRNELLEEPMDSTSQCSLRRESIHHTAPPGLQETVPPSSPATSTVAVDEVSYEEACDASQKLVSTDLTRVKEGEDGDSPKFRFGWRKRLDEMDEESDKEDVNPSAEGSMNEAPKVSFRFGNARLLQDSKNDTTQLDSNESTIHPPASDVFTCPLSSSSGYDVPRTSFTLSSPPVAVQKSRILVNSDSEDEQLKDSSSTAPSTSGRVSLGFSKSRSSSTQPTSDEELPSQVSVEPKKDVAGPGHFSVSALELADLGSSIRKKRTRDRKGKAKAPTKKELKETAKERGRLAAQAKVIIPKTGKSSKYTLERLLTAVSAQPIQPHISDPIEPFTSSPVKASPSRECPLAESLSPSAPLPEKVRDVVPDSDDSEGELPEVGELLKQDAQKRNAEELNKIKMLALKQPRAVTHDDDELMVSTDPKATVKEEEEHRRLKQSRPSAARKIVAQYGNIKAAKKAAVISPSRIRKNFTSILQDPSLTSGEFKRIMLVKAQEHASLEIRKKEEEWTKHGGRLAAKVSVPTAGLDLTMKVIAGKGLEKVEERKLHQRHVDGDASEEDEEWTPEFQGSALPPLEEGLKSEEGIEDNRFADADVAMVGEGDLDDLDSDETRVHKSRRNVILDSEEEDGDVENVSMKSIHQKNRRSSTSSGLATEDENDKENNTKLMYDQGEDKENVRVVRHSPVSKRQSIFDLTQQGLASSSPVSQIVGSERNDFDDGMEQRRPFQELMSKESPESKLRSPSTLTQPFANQLCQISPLSNTLTPAPSLKPLLVETDSSTSFGGFSQFSQVERVVLATTLQPGFSDLFEAGTEKGKSSTTAQRLDEFSENLITREFKRVETLGLTQDVAADLQLQPAFQAEETLMRKAAAIVEKEQAFVIEANSTKLTRKVTELYVNDLGFLTQTKPTDGTPDIYRRSSPAPTLSSMMSPFESHTQTQTPSQRIPLQTISLSSESQFEQAPFRRLRRAGKTLPRSDDRSLTPSPSIQQRRVLDAHEVLRRAQEVERKRQETKRKRSELGGFLEDEAAESDDEMFGFVAKKPDDDEEGEDLDQNLPELVDDQVMDVETEAADLVLDKYKEHLELDDKENEELHQAAVQGQLRKRRKHGVGVDDSDEDSDADDNERARRAMKRARKSDRTDIKGLEANQETRAFADSYNQSLRDDDDDDFVFLSKTVEIAEILTGHESDVGDAEGEEDQVETVDVQEIYRTVRERAQEGRLSMVPMDLHDVSWIDEDMEPETQVRRIDPRQRPKQEKLESSGLDAMGPVFRKSTSLVSDASKHWGAQTRENNSRSMATARSVGGSAITGHTKARPRSGVVTGRPTQEQLEASKVKPLRAAASGILSADKSRSFM